MRLPLAIAALLLFSACAEDADRRDLETARESLEEEVDRARERLDELEERLEDIAEAGRDDADRLREGTERLREDADRLRENSDEWREDVDEALESSLSELGRALERFGEGLQEGSDVQPVDWRDMKSMLPDEVAGFDRVHWEGHNKKALGIRMSTIKGDYERGSDELHVAIVDLGSLSGFATAGYNWLDANIDSESDQGYERTTEIEGYPAFVDVEYGSRQDELNLVVIVEERFALALSFEGEDLDDSLLDEAIDDISIRRLRRMAR